MTEEQQTEEKKKSFFFRVLARILAIFHRRPLPPTEPTPTNVPVIEGDFRQTPSPHTMSEMRISPVVSKNEIEKKWAEAVKQEQEETTKRRELKRKNFEKAKSKHSSTITCLPMEKSFSARLPDSDKSSVNDPEDDTVNGTGQLCKTGTAIDINSKTGISRTEKTSPYIDLSTMGSAGSYLSETVELHMKTLKEEEKKRKPVATPTTPHPLVRASPEKKGQRCITPCQTVHIPRESPSPVHQTTPSPTPSKPVNTPSPAQTTTPKPTPGKPLKTPSPGPFGWRTKITIKKNGSPRVEPTQSELNLSVNKPNPSPISEGTSKKKTTEQCKTPKAHDETKMGEKKPKESGRKHSKTNK